MSLKPDSDFITNHNKNIYDVREAFGEGIKRFPVLKAVLDANIMQLVVEYFFVQSSTKPHLAFRVNFSSPVEVAKRSYRSCFISMNAHPQKAGVMAPGACKIEICDYYVMTEGARVAFQFEVKSRFITLGDLLSAITGTCDKLPGDMKTDLTQFRFIVVTLNTGRQSHNGCRDWLIQVFIRFHALGWVGWMILGIFQPEREFKPIPHLGAKPSQGLGIHDPGRQKFMPRSNVPTQEYINWNRASFHDIIGKRFSQPIQERFKDSRGNEYRASVIYYETLLVDRGVFPPVTGVIRVSQLNPEAKLPYVKFGKASHGSRSGRGGGVGTKKP